MLLFTNANEGAIWQQPDIDNSLNTELIYWAKLLASNNIYKKQTNTSTYRDISIHLQYISSFYHFTSFRVLYFEISSGLEEKLSTLFCEKKQANTNYFTTRPKINVSKGTNFRNNKKRSLEKNVGLYFPSVPASVFGPTIGSPREKRSSASWHCWLWRVSSSLNLILRRFLIEGTVTAKVLSSRKTSEKMEDRKWERQPFQERIISEKNLDRNRTRNLATWRREEYI